MEIGRTKTIFLGRIIKKIRSLNEFYVNKGTVFITVHHFVVFTVDSKIVLFLSIVFHRRKSIVEKKMYRRKGIVESIVDQQCTVEGVPLSHVPLSSIVFHSWVDDTS